jgi:hypothetical protein
LVIRDRTNVVKKSAELWREDVGREEFFGFDFELVEHHLLQPLLVSLITPWELSYSEVTEEE